MALEIFLNTVDYLAELHIYIIDRDVDGRTTAIARPMDDLRSMLKLPRRV